MSSMSYWIIPATLTSLLVVSSGCSPENEPADTQSPVVQVEEEQAMQTEGIALLEDEADRQAAREQAICPVSGEPLGSMGKPIRLTVEGQEVFICCSGCEDALREDPQTYLSKINPPADPTQ